MLLYHGTSEKAAKNILKTGIKPRVETELKGNWEHSIDSRNDCVYLTSVYAPYFAMAATDEVSPDNRWCVVEIDVDRIDDGLLLPDEDFLEQASRKSKVPDGPEYEGLRIAQAIEDSTKRMHARTEWFRENLDCYWQLWEDSIKGLGNCCLQDEVHPTAITRIAYFDPKSNPNVAMTSMDPMICLMNFAIMEPKYAALTKWFMGEEVSAGDLFGGFTAKMFPSDNGDVVNPFYDEEREKSAQEALGQTDGLEVIRLRRPFAEEQAEEEAAG